MLKKLKISLVSLIAFGLFAVPVFAVAGTSSAASINTGLCQGSNLKLTDAGTPQGDCTPTGNGSELNNLLTRVVNIISVIVGVIAVIMIIYGGFKYITSGGDSGNVTGAKNTILYAIIGLVIVALAQFIVRFVVGASSNLTTP